MLQGVIIDDEEFAIEELDFNLKDSAVNIVAKFSDPFDGYDSIVAINPDIVFLDIDMPYINGLELAVKIQAILPDTAIVFITAYPQFALEAYKSYPIDFIMKPIQKTRLNRTISHIEDIKRVKNEKCELLKIKVFGKFEFTSGNVPIKFPTKKSRELLLFLILNFENTINNDCILNALFNADDKEKNLNNLYVTLFRLRKCLLEAGISSNLLSICANENGSYKLTINDGVCDYVDFCRFIAINNTITKDNAKKACSIIESINDNILNDIDSIWIAEFRAWIIIHSEELIIKTASYYYCSTRGINTSEKLLLLLLDLNPLSEQAYQRLLDIYIRTKQLQKFSYYFSKYVNLMQEELNCSPNERYVNFAKRTFASN